MKTKPLSSSILLLLLPCSGFSQGSFIYDQQSSDENMPGEVSAGIQANQPAGQSFTPTNSAVGFVRLQFHDVNPGNGLGATLRLDLFANSFTSGSLLGSTIPVFMPDGYPGVNTVGFTNFFFSSPIPVTPGVTYYFQIIVQSGDAWAVGRYIPFSDYSGGTEYFNGLPGSDDLWFREGIIIPEPSSMLFAVVSAALVVSLRRCYKRTGDHSLCTPRPRIRS